MDHSVLLSRHQQPPGFRPDTAATTVHAQAPVPSQRAPAFLPSRTTPTDTAPPSANVTVVRTAQELQEATLSGAVDIEIAQHLNLGTLTRPPNPAMPGRETFQNRKHLALLYASQPLRSIRGNCGDPNPAAALGLSADLAAGLLPLRPRQCLLLLPDTWLVVNSGTLWLDNIYLRASRTRANPVFTFIQFGVRDAYSSQSLVDRSSTYITRLTFQPDGRGTTIGITADTTNVAAIVDDCVFTDWVGFRSPFVIKYQSVIHIHNTVLRNFNLVNEIADVSFDGIVHFSNVSLANVTLQRGAVVSTTLNDYERAIGYSLTYYADDDDAYDVPIKPVPAGEASMWGEEFVIADASMGDCVFLLVPDITMYPGCPPEAATRRSEMKGRAVGGIAESNRPDNLVVRDYGGGRNTGASDYHASDYRGGADPPAASVDSDGGDYASYADYSTDVLYALSPEALYDYQMMNQPSIWFASRFLDMDDPWILSTQQVLPKLPTAPSWPPFELNPMPTPGNRTSLLPVFVQVGDGRGSQLHGPPLVPVLAGPANQPLQPQSHDQSFYVPFLVVACIAAVVVTVVMVKLFPRHWLEATADKWRQLHSDVNGVDTVQVMSTKDSQTCKKTDSDALRRTASVKGHRRGPPKRLGNQLTPLSPDFEEVLPPQLAIAAHVPGVFHGTSKPKGDRVLSGPRTPHTDAIARSQGHPAQQGRRGRRGDATSINGGGTDMYNGGPDTTLSTQQQHVLRLHQQLDLFRDKDVFLGRFKLLGRRQRRRGGQAEVQFMKDVDDRCHYAAKFFLNREDFLREAAVYAACFPSLRSTGLLQAATAAHAQARSGALWHSAEQATAAEAHATKLRIAPPVAAICDAGTPGLRDPEGEPLPPCIVMERGESLQDWSERAVPDLFTSLAVLSNISKRLADMHEAGYAHRDLKPANIMWLSCQSRWTIINFGGVERIGQRAPLRFTLAYAAPEVAAASHRNDKRMECRAALDAWSLGVIAFELLTGAPAFDLLEDGAPGVAARLLGEAPLPWEGTAGGALKQRLGTFLEPVLNLLQREPSNRTSMRAFSTYMAVCTRNATAAQVTES
eukprot:jgi/Ulvmu1/1088/UM106_0004.1